MLCSEYQFYHGNYWQTDWPSTFGNIITFKDSTDTSSQIPTDSSGKARRKRILLIGTRPLSDKALPHVTYSQPIQLRSAHILCLATDVIRIKPYLGSVVKLSIVRRRTSINWPSNSLGHWKPVPEMHDFLQASLPTYGLSKIHIHNHVWT
jgi:hypothetical protein